MKLKPCPFCKGEPQLHDSATDFDWVIPNRRYYQVRCMCGVRGPLFYEHRDLAVQGWNKVCRKEA